MPPPNPSPPVQLPDGTITLVRELVPAVRSLLRRGLTDDFQKACVRIGSYENFGGGLKATLVGGLRIDVHAAIKLGDRELLLHRALMEAVNAVRPATFPVILELVDLGPERQLLLMEDLRSHATLLDLIFRDGIADQAAGRILDKVVEGLRAVCETGLREAAWPGDLPTQRDPFTARLRERLAVVVKNDPALQPIFTRPGRVLGQPCPPLGELLASAARFMAGAAGKIAPVLQHGDPHLGNIMARARGRGHSVKLIDPNPNVGFTDPLYDVGKLLHWAEPVGWAKVQPAACHAGWHCGRSGWELTAHCAPPDAAAERRRAHLVARLTERIPRLLPDESPDTLRRRLPLAIAAAHIGLAALLRGDTNRAPRRFVLAHTLRHLAEWWANACANSRRATLGTP